MFSKTTVHQSIVNDGYAVVRAFKPELSSIDAFETFGKIDSVEGLNSIQALIPREISSTTPNTYSGNFGMSEFPLHTDLAHWAVPPRYLALRCLNGTSTVATHLYDGTELISRFGMESLCMALVKPRRPMQNGQQLLRLLERSDIRDIYRIRWDCLFLKPASATAEELLHRMKIFISNVNPVEVVLLNRGDTLIIDNWRCLHGRSSALGGELARHIDRAYLNSIND